MLGSCCSASCASRPSACAPRSFVSSAAAARPQHQQLRPCSVAQHRPTTATVVAAASRGGGGRGSSAGRSPSTTGRGRGMSAAGGINTKHLNSSISGCLDAEALMQLVERHAASFDFIHASTALTRAAKLMEAPLSADEEECIAQLLRVAGRQLEQCGAWALANMAWALAKLDYNDSAFLQRLVQQASKRLSQFNGHDTANMLWALVELGFEDKVMLRRLFLHARNVSDFTPQGVSNVLMAMAKSKHVAEDRQLVEQLLADVQPQLPDFNEQDLSNTAWALARLRHYDQDFMEQLLQQAEGTLATLNAQAISSMLWALANLGHNSPGFVDVAIKRLLLLNLMEVERQSLCNVLWAASILQHNAAPLAEPLIAAAAAALSASDSDEFRESQLSQVYRYLVAMEGAGVVSKHLQASAQYQSLWHACHTAFLTAVREEQSQPIPFTKDVLHVLRKLPGCDTAQAVQLTEDQQLTTDVCVTLPCGIKVAVEVELQTACMANAPDKPLGPLLWRRKQLAARGYKVVVVQQADWLDVGPEMQQLYLRMRFREAGVVLPASSSVAGAA